MQAGLSDSRAKSEFGPTMSGIADVEAESCRRIAMAVHMGDGNIGVSSMRWSFGSVGLVLYFGEPYAGGSTSGVSAIDVEARVYSPAPRVVDCFLRGSASRRRA